MTQTPQFAEINGTRIAYSVTGNGFPLLMLHGFPRTRRTWESVTPALAQRFTEGRHPSRHQRNRPRLETHFP